MRLRNVPGSREVIAAHPLCFLEEDPQSPAGRWAEIFGSNHPIHIEVGMGKGQFITTLAMQNPAVNYIGIEKYSSVLVRALEKLDAMETPPSNIRFIRMDAENICSMFARHEVSRIYLNFSDPWPKERHAKRRLTSRQFFERYDQILAPRGVVEFKTDNKPLFEFSLEETEEAGWKLMAHTFDLHHDPSMNEGNVMTEYEEKFSSMGNPIYKLIAGR